MIALLLASLLLAPIQAPQTPAPPVIAVPAADVTQDLKLNDGVELLQVRVHPGLPPALALSPGVIEPDVRAGSRRH